MYARESSRRQNKSLLVSAMEAETRHYLHTNNSRPPKRRKVPAHAGLREFVICDVSVLLSSTGQPATDSLDTIQCLHSNPLRGKAVLQSLRARPLPAVLNGDAYEQEQQSEDEDWTLNQLFDDNDDEEDGEREAQWRC